MFVIFNVIVKYSYNYFYTNEMNINIWVLKKHNFIKINVFTNLLGTLKCNSNIINARVQYFWDDISNKIAKYNILGFIFIYWLIVWYNLLL